MTRRDLRQGCGLGTWDAHVQVHRLLGGPAALRAALCSDGVLAPVWARRGFEERQEGTL